MTREGARHLDWTTTHPNGNHQPADWSPFTHPTMQEFEKGLKSGEEAAIKTKEELAKKSKEGDKAE